MADGKGARDGDRATDTDPHRRAARGSRAQRVADGAGPRTNSRGARRSTGAVSLAPDYADPLIGWRTWAAFEEGGGLMLRSTVYRAAGPRGRQLGAACAYRARFGVIGRVVPIEAHEAPGEGCTCGIYAARSPELALRYLGRVGLLRGDKAASSGRSRSGAGSSSMSTAGGRPSPTRGVCTCCGRAPRGGDGTPTSWPSRWRATQSRSRSWRRARWKRSSPLWLRGRTSSPARTRGRGRTTWVRGPRCNPGPERTVPEALQGPVLWPYASERHLKRRSKPSDARAPRP